jgi:hypothetical protein
LCALAGVAGVAGCGGSRTSAPAARAPRAAAVHAPGPACPPARHAHRPAGTVYSDEIGELVLACTRAQVVDRFGAPARTRVVNGARCDFYAVGRGARGWRFCFDARGRMAGASGNQPLR